jgi:outer membrane protein assembly factor BamB
MNKTVPVYLALAWAWFLLGSASPARAGDWPRFRGPNGSAVSEDPNVPVEFGPDKNLRWKVELPARGVSSPVVARGRVYVTGSTGYRERRLHVLCYDQLTGKKLWERQLASTGNTACHPKTSMAGPTPACDGENVYALFATGDLAGFDCEGNLLWYRSLVGDYPDISNQVGMAASPVLAGDVLLLPMENAGESFAAGLDKKTGKNLWKKKRLRDINWVTPVVVKDNDRLAGIYQTRKDVTAYDVKTGEVLWRFEGDKLSSVQCPVLGEGLVFVSGGPHRALKPVPGEASPEEVWNSLQLGGGYPSIFYHGGRVYGMTRVGVGCLDAGTGKPVWQMRLSGKFSASPILVGGKLYTTSEEGIITVIAAGKTPRILARNHVGETLLATPAVSNGALFVRGYTTLYCFATR